MQKKGKQKKLIIILATVIIIIALFVFTPLGNIISGIFGENPNIYVSIDNPNDDSRTFTSGDEFGGDENGKWATLQLSTTYSFGLRFNNISIPKNAEIVKAYIELYSIGTPGHQSPNCKIYCDDTDNAVNFSEKGVLDLCGRKYTYSHTRWNTTVPYGEWVKTPSLVDQLQEVILNKNWKKDNSVAFLFVTECLKGYSATFQNYEAGYPARLYVEWEE